jgi:hypothetical protein
LRRVLPAYFLRPAPRLVFFRPLLLLRLAPLFLFAPLFVLAVLFFFVLRGGTLPPSFRASDKPIAIACLRLLTVLPEPLFNVPRLRSRIVRATFSPAFAP